MHRSRLRSASGRLASPLYRPAAPLRPPGDRGRYPTEVLMARPRFDAIISFLHADDGGRREPPQPPFTEPNRDYRPHLVVDGDSTYLGVRFIGGPSIPPGGEGRFSFVPTYPDNDYSAIKVGTRFTVREGQRTVAHGVVLHVLPIGWPRDGDSRCSTQTGG